MLALLAKTRPRFTILRRSINVVPCKGKRRTAHSYSLQDNMENAKEVFTLSN